MKNIPGFYCKQPSLPLNTAGKGYRISHRPLSLSLSPHTPPAPPRSVLPKISTAKSAPVLRLESGEDVGKGGKNPGVQPCGGHPALGEGCLLCGGSLELPSAGYQLSNTTLDQRPGFVFCLLPTSLILFSFPSFFSFFSCFVSPLFIYFFFLD